MDPALIKRMLHDEFDTYTKLTVMDNEISYFFKRWLGEVWIHAVLFSLFRPAIQTYLLEK